MGSLRRDETPGEGAAHPPAGLSRRAVLGGAGVLGVFAAWGGLPGCVAVTDCSLRPRSKAPPWRYSLAEWSLHRALQQGRLDHLDFPRHAREVHGLEAVEYVNSFFKDKVGDGQYLLEMRRRALDVGVRSLLIMIDGEGKLAVADEAERRRAVDNHLRWFVAAASLGCDSIRLNLEGEGDEREWSLRASESLHTLGQLADPLRLNVLVENHGGPSSNGAWLAATLRAADHPRVGALPDFGNFRIAEGVTYDRYRGVAELMPFAKAVSAKSHDFDADGNEVHTDYRRMLRIVADAGYRGWIGVEYEGPDPDEDAGIARTLHLLRTVEAEIAAEARAS